MMRTEEDPKVLRVVVVSANANRLAPGSVAEADYQMRQAAWRAGRSAGELTFVRTEECAKGGTSIFKHHYEAECSARIDEMTALCESERHFTNLATGETWTEPYEEQP